MKIEPGVNFPKLATQTEGFSGADLQALVYNAHLESVHDVLAIAPSIDTEVDGTNKFVVLRKGSDQLQSKAQQAATNARVCFFPATSHCNLTLC
jgi:peroxin-1